MTNVPTNKSSALNALCKQLGDITATVAGMVDRMEALEDRIAAVETAPVTNLVTALSPYRQRATRIVDLFADLHADALPAATSLLEELDRLFVEPLTAAYTATPTHDIDTEDAIWRTVYGLAGVHEVAQLESLAKDGPTEPGENADGRMTELINIANRYHAAHIGT